MEAVPLVMEPESRMYCDPVVVLDFQSLYPSQVGVSVVSFRCVCVCLFVCVWCVCVVCV